MAFVAFEGLDGSGKTSLIKALSSELKNQGLGFILSREPGGTPLAEEIRTLLLRTEGEAPISRAELLLYEAGRAQHVEKVIRPALMQKKWVLCDRFTASSVAFQCGGRNLDLQKVTWLNDYATDGLYPDITVLLDLTVEESRKRRDGRNKNSNTEDDRFEKEAADFHERVRQSYLKQAKENKNSWIILDSSQPTDKMSAQLLNTLREKKWLES